MKMISLILLRNPKAVRQTESSVDHRAVQAMSRGGKIYIHIMNSKSYLRPLRTFVILNSARCRTNRVALQSGCGFVQQAMMRRVNLRELTE